MGSSKTKSTQVTDMGPWQPQQDYLKQGFSEAQSLYNDGPAAYYPGQTYTNMDPNTQAGLQAQIGIANDGNPVVNNAAGYVANTLGGYSDNPYAPLLTTGARGMAQTASGAYLNSNPYLDATYSSAANRLKTDFSESVMPELAAQFGSGGMAGSTAHELMAGKAGSGLMSSLSDLAANIYGSNYQSERDRQVAAQQGLTTAGTSLYGTGVGERVSAAQMAPDIRTAQYGDAAKLQEAGAAYTDQANKALEADINRWNYEQNKDQAALQDYMSMISGNYGQSGTTTTTSKTSGNPVATVLGGVTAGLGLYDNWNKTGSLVR